MKTTKAIVIMAIAIVGIMALIPIVSAAEGTATGTEDKLYWGLIAIGAGLAVGIAGFGAGYAEAAVGAAAVGAVAEDQKLFSKGLILMVIPETIVVFGFVIAIFLWLKMA